METENPTTSAEGVEGAEEEDEEEGDRTDKVRELLYINFPPCT